MRHTIEAADAAGLHDVPSISRHALPWLTQRQCLLPQSNAEALGLWREAAPGTLFFWENKYCGSPEQEHSGAEVWAELNRLGEMLLPTWFARGSEEEYQRGDLKWMAQSAVFRRLPNTPATAPAGP